MILELKDLSNSKNKYTLKSSKIEMLVTNSKDGNEYCKRLPRRQKK